VISARPHSQEAWKFLLDRFTTCINDHGASCGSGPRKLPTRLLDIGPEGSDTVRLFETKPSESGRYAALSYCWGTKPFIKCTSVTITSLKQGISITALPRTFQDAFVVMRRLDVRLVWIDAFCIIQDSSEDWQREAALMARLYANAYITIAASTAASAEEGFLSLERCRAVQVPCLDEDGEPTVVCFTAEPWSGRHALTPPHEDPWAQRAWTMQESALSTRMISYSRDELQWQCKSCMCCECHSGPASPPESLLEVQKPEEAFRAWHQLVCDYSGRRLTYHGDRLPAVAAVASRIQSLTASSYLGGLWVGNLIADLCWQRTFRSWPEDSQGLQDATLPRGGYRAPSFSWASVESPVYYNTHDSGAEPYTSVEAVTCELASPKYPFLHVRRASVTLRGPVYQISIKKGPSNDSNLPLGYQVEMPGHALPLEFTADALIDVVSLTDGQGARFHTLCRSESSRFAFTSPPKEAEHPGQAGVAKESLAISRRLMADGESLAAHALLLTRLFSQQYPEDKGSKCLLILGKDPENPAYFQRLGCTMLETSLWEFWGLESQDAIEKVQTITLV
jgi:hypothetical protein